MATQVDFPQKLQCLFLPKRYKILHGGRGGAKSWGIARALLIMGTQRPLRVLCARELQNSIADSVHKLLSDQIKALGLEELYEIQQARIIGPNGTSFGFEGIRHNIARLKSYEGADICWVEEAHMVPKSSWDILVPTIRKEGSEIWISFNPDLESDETYQRFVVNPPKESFVVQVNWRDNPWFPEVLREEMLELKVKDRDAYLNVWEGNCRVMLDGAVYAEEIRQALAEGRFCSVPYDPTKGVSTFWDLGWADSTSIWFAQKVGFETRVIDYYSNSQKPINHYLAHMQSKRYIYDTVWLPHDARAKQLGSGKSIEEIVRAQGHKVRIVPKLSLVDGINAARTVFPGVWVDSKACAEGIKCLQHYRYEVVPDSGTFSRQPLHDWASHGADGFRYLAVALREGKSRDTAALGYAQQEAKLPGFLRDIPHSLGWMR